MGDTGILTRRTGGQGTDERGGGRVRTRAVSPAGDIRGRTGWDKVGNGVSKDSRLWDWHRVTEGDSWGVGEEERTLASLWV